MKTRDLPKEFLHDWKRDLSITWREVVRDVDLDYQSRSFDGTPFARETVIPGRRRAPIQGAPPHAHMFRAFDDISPLGVRAVILGQDPYPNPAWATGRAFEQGNLTDWPEERRLVAHSLARIVQSLAAARTQNSKYVSGDRAWQTLIRELQNQSLHLEPADALFDRLVRNGVPCLNTSLTIGLDLASRAPKRRRSHFPLWRPLIRSVLSYLAARDSGHVVFLLWGGHAAGVFEQAGIRQVAQHAGTWHKRVATALHFHPAAITKQGAVFLSGPNPFVSANSELARIRAPAWAGRACAISIAVGLNRVTRLAQSMPQSTNRRARRQESRSTVLHPVPWCPRVDLRVSRET